MQRIDFLANENIDVTSGTLSKKKNHRVYNDSIWQKKAYEFQSCGWQSKIAS